MALTPSQRRRVDRIKKQIQRQHQWERKRAEQLIEFLRVCLHQVEQDGHISFGIKPAPVDLTSFNRISSSLHDAAEAFGLRCKEVTIDNGPCWQFDRQIMRQAA